MRSISVLLAIVGLLGTSALAADNCKECVVNGEFWSCSTWFSSHEKNCAVGEGGMSCASVSPGCQPGSFTSGLPVLSAGGDNETVLLFDYSTIHVLAPRDPRQAKALYLFNLFGGLLANREGEMMVLRTFDRPFTYADFRELVEAPENIQHSQTPSSEFLRYEFRIERSVDGLPSALVMVTSADVVRFPVCKQTRTISWTCTAPE